MSGELMADAGEGEAYETLDNRLAGLHQNIVAIAVRAKAISARAAKGIETKEGVA